MTSLTLAALTLLLPAVDVCERVKDLAIPREHRPNAAETRALIGSMPEPDAVLATPECGAEALYYGIGVPADPVKARHCAILERDPEWDAQKVFGGDAILMMLYANGEGVPRDLELATHFACAIGGAPAEIEARLAHLAELRALGAEPPRDLDLCDDITSGFMMGHCAARDQRIAAAGRQSHVEEIAARWSPKARAAFRELRTAADAWIRARAHGEVDLSGTARSAFVVEEEEKQETALVAMIEALERHESSLFRSFDDDLARADADHRETFADVIANADFSWTTVTPDDIRAADAAWAAYRDAWIGFVAVAYPSAEGDAVAAALTDERTAMLREFLAD